MSMAPAVADSAILLATFSLNDGMYAIDASRVQEIIRPREMTSVPHSSGAVLGVINLRGRIVTVFDAGVLLGVGDKNPGKQVTSDNRIIIVTSRGEFVGLMVEKVTEVRETEASTREPAPGNVSGEREGLVTDVYRIDGRVIALLDTEAMLGSEAACRGQRGNPNESARPRSG